MKTDTIFALASARGKSGVGVIRVSGPSAHEAAKSLCGNVPPRRRACLRTLRRVSGEVLDTALVLTFDEGHSFTGEQSVEFHVHGGVATIDAVLQELASLPGFRMAEPGEFTRRALENERLDLAQVEGLADLIDAETEAQRRQAQRVFSGELGEKVGRWREKLVRAAALLEATIDFADEDIPEDVTPEVSRLLQEVSDDLRREVRGSEISERIRDGFEVAIVGPPNIGKSTLLNTLAGREAAITSEIAGTTRDVIEVRMDLRGLPVTLLDTAGLRETTDKVEAIGVDRARERARGADLRVFLVGDEGESVGLEPQGDDIVVRGKADLGRGSGDGVSGKTGEGIDRMVERIAGILEKRASNAATATRARHRAAMTRAIEALESARVEVEAGPDRVEIAAEELRRAAVALASIVGVVGVEDLLDEIFASFCLGK